MLSTAPKPAGQVLAPIAPDAHVVVAGGGVAALESVLALRADAPAQLRITLLSPDASFTLRPLSVLEPFAMGEATRVDLERFAAEQHAELRRAALVGVEPERRRALLDRGGALAYDVLVVAVGAQPMPGVPGALTFRDSADRAAFTSLLRDLDRGAVRRVAFALPGGGAWPLPLYELALLTAAHVAARSLEAEVVLVTPEDEPLEAFGRLASEEVRRLLAAERIELHTTSMPIEFAGGELAVVGGAPIAAERVVALPRLAGPGIAGLPHDANGFLPADLLGRVAGMTDVYAAGDATTFALKQGGLAAQQADAVASSIASRAGAPVAPEPFRPVLRGLLVTGVTPRRLEAEVSGGRGEAPPPAAAPLWWPAAKVTGRHLTGYLTRSSGVTP